MIDWNRVQALREEVGPEDFDEVVDLFLEEVDAEIDALGEIELGAALGEKLHFLKGSALSLGFEAFSQLCQQSEARIAADPQTPVDLGSLQRSYAASRSRFLADLAARLAS